MPGSISGIKARRSQSGATGRSRARATKHRQRTWVDRRRIENTVALEMRPDSVGGRMET